MNIEYMSSNGTVFKAAERDLSGGVVVETSWLITPIQLGADFAEFGAWHQREVWEDLESFAGYDAVRYFYKGV